ncbi:MAG TPA: CDP-alcohol phosphatidyltransferase family protein [Nocardioidaceae bacterium]|jgi:CDP-diacylglycerol--glycerol-3-phosphate 3-phosphatidyltransferase|nr:CDP-alcohol phosphatidyltransferase family protein [Nocardioidaceae bacterium]
MTRTRGTEPDVYADPAAERVGTSATWVTFVRTLVSVVLSAVAATQGSLPLLVVALAVYWAGDMLDGLVARVRGCETRTGAVLDILSDRFCAAAFYVGLVWLQPELAAPVFVYLAEFMVIDCFVSLAFLAWPLRSPNYFFVVDRPLWRWNWSTPAKTANSSLFAVLLLVTGWVWLGVAIAVALLALKLASLVRLVRLGLPVPERPSGGPVAERAPQAPAPTGPVG